MATKVVYTLREDKQGLQKQFGCMNGIFQLFDRRYLLGLHRHGRNQNRLTPGECENGIKNSSEKVKERNVKKVVIEKGRASIESSRNSCSSSCSSTTFSSLDCSKRVQTEWQFPSEPTSPNFQKKQKDSSLPDIKDVVKNAMTRQIRVASKDERVCHVDSPRPFLRQKSVEYDRKYRTLEKVQKFSVKEAKETSRFSCDERESKYSLKSTVKVKELPRLSLDSKQNSKKNETLNQSHDPGSNKRPSSGVVARLMGLESLTDSILEVETLKINKPCLDDDLVSKFTQNHVSVSVRGPSPEKAGGDRGGRKPPLKKTEAPVKAKNGSSSVYGEMEKRLSAIEFKASGKDLRALKQILEAIHSKEWSTDSQKTAQPVLTTIKGLRKVNHVDNRNDLFGGKRVKEPALRKKKATGESPRFRSPSNSPEQLTGERPVSKARLQRSKKDSSDSNRIKKQSNPRNQKKEPINPMQNEDKRNLNKDGDKDSRNDQPNENHRDNFVERLIEDKPMVELAKLTIEQPSPVSVLDAFCTEDTPSPVKKKPTAFNDYESLHFDETEWNQDQYSEFNQIEYDDMASPCKSTNEDHKYINKILLASGFLKDLDFAIRIVQLHPIGSLINPELFHLLEKTYERHKKSKSNEIMRRKMIFDSVNEILLHKLTVAGSSGRLLNGEKLLKELCSEIDNLQTTPEKSVYDEDDEVKNLVSADVNKKSEDWDKCFYEVSGIVLDIERLIFKDLIDEVVNADVSSVHDRPGRH